MDTRFWGPSGWKLLHTITFTYETDNKQVKEFFELLPFVLPCKFCRSSLTEYMEDDPIDMKSRDALSKWLWRIHNKVNDKLRGQGLLHDVNPSFSAVKKVYEERISAGCVKTEFEGWDFLFSIAENHPYSKFSKSLPMEGCPSKESVLCEKDKNRWNLMNPEERFRKYTDFWKVVGKVLPFQEWRDAWSACEIPEEALEKRVSLVKALWRLRCCMEKNLELVNREQFQSLCKKLVNHRSGCGKKKRAKTCRKSRTLKSSSYRKSKK